MANAARKNVAYSIIDVDNLDIDNGNELLEKIRQIPDVYRVRLIKHR